jgi:hypothetical protein
MLSTTAADMVHAAKQQMEHLMVAQVAAEVAWGDVVPVHIHEREEQRTRRGQRLRRDTADRGWPLCTTRPMSRVSPAQMR